MDYSVILWKYVRYVFSFSSNLEFFLLIFLTIAMNIPASVLYRKPPKFVERSRLVRRRTVCRLRSDMSVNIDFQ